MSDGAAWGSKEWANEQLRFAIGCLDGSRVGASDRGRIHLALFIKDRLTDYGFPWQVRILNCHIHRFQKGLKHKVTGFRRISRE